MYFFGFGMLKASESENKNAKNKEDESRKSSFKNVLRKITVSVLISALLAASAIGIGPTANPYVPTINPAIVKDMPTKTLNQKINASMVILQQLYNKENGQWSDAKWWQNANILETVINYTSITGSKRYAWMINNTFIKNTNFINEYYDDEGWWALTWLKAYQLTGNNAYLATSKSIFEDMTKGWDKTCGGGVWWDKAHTRKNAITNELFLRVALTLHQVTPGDKKYLNWAYKEYNWLMGSGLVSNSGLINDSLGKNCRVSNTEHWTYTQGEMMATLVEFEKITGNNKYMIQAQTIANANNKYNVDKNGVLYDKTCPVNNICYTDMEGFKGTYINGLRDLYMEDKNKAYLVFIDKNIKAIWLKDRSNFAELGLYWDGPFTEFNSATQSAAINAMLAGELRK